VRLPIPRGRRAILIVGVPVGLAAAGIFVFTQVIAGSGGPVPDPGPGEHGVMIALDSRVVNLKVETAADYKYAKVAVTIEMRPTTASFYKMTGADRAKKRRPSSRATAIPCRCSRTPFSGPVFSHVELALHAAGDGDAESRAARGDA